MTEILRKIGSAPWDDDIDWLLNEAPGLLGESGMAISPDSGGGGGYVDTGPIHARQIGAMWAVRRERRLRMVWQSCSQVTKRVLVAHYDRRRRVDEMGARFQELTGVVLATAGDVEDLRRAIIGKDAKAKRDAVKSARAAALVAVKLAHSEWREVRVSRALEER